MPKFIIKKSNIAKINSKPNKIQNAVSLVFLAVMAVLSIPVVTNLLSSNQAMNTSFNRIHLANTYGAFGSIGKIRLELVVEGTDEDFINDNTKWKQYEFKAKPTSLERPLPVVAPYHYRLDWEIWFAAMSSPEYHPWMIHFVWKLLNNDPLALKLIEENPFPNEPPKYIRVERYVYSFAKLNEEVVWKRERAGPWLPPLAISTPNLKGFVESNWKQKFR